MGALNRAPRSWKEEFINVGYVFSLSREKFLKCELKFPKRDKGIYILCNYNNDLFIALKNQLFHYEGFNYWMLSTKNFREDDLYLFKYKDKTFKEYKSLSLTNTNDSFKGIIKLKNNNLIIFSSNELKLIKLI
jgi:hypothetical protein